MLTATDRKTLFERDGYWVAEAIFSRDEMAAAKDEIRRILAEVRAERAGDEAKNRSAARENGVYVGLSIRSAFFRRLNADARLVDVLAEIVGPNLEFWSDKVVYKSAHVEFGSPWHQDWHYWKGAHKYSLWVALDEATPENGCLKVLPGTHTSVVHHGGKDTEGVGFGNRLAQDQIDERQAVDLPAKPGTVVFFHDLLLHASHPNRSGQERWALIPTYRDASQDDLRYEFAKAAFIVRGQRTGKVLGPSGR